MTMIPIQKQLILMLLLLAFNSLSKIACAQGPYSYNSPNGEQMIFQSANLYNISGTALYPDNWAVINNQELTGIEIDCRITIDLSKTIKVLTFFDGTNNKYLEIFYKQNTLFFRRYKTPDVFYDYQLLDPLFIATQQGGQFEFKIYFTGSFFWIQTIGIQNAAGNYLSPVYFGLDKFTDKHIQELLTNNPNAHIIIGTPTYQNFYINGYVNVFAFNPKTLLNNIQKNFSEVTGYNPKPITPLAEDDAYQQ